nr:MAG TPA: hypothetical protein [Caudoviricetes sp.]
MAENHYKDLTIYEMVLNRLPFLLDTDKNKNRVSEFTLEVMAELEVCFRIDKDLPQGHLSRVGDENYYSIIQRTIIADIVAVYIIMLQMMANLAGVADVGSGITANSNKFLSHAEAGSVNVSWEQFDINKASGLVLTGEKLLMLYKKSAIRKAHSIGCLIDICDDCTLAVELMMNHTLPTPRVIVSSDCGCCGQPPERFFRP